MAITALTPALIPLQSPGLPGVPGAPGFDYESVAAAAAQTIPSTAKVVRIGGYSLPTTGGDAPYASVAAQPAHQMKFQEVGGRWYEFSADEVNLFHGGATDDDTDASRTGNATALTRVLSYLSTTGKKRLKVLNRKGGGYRFPTNTVTTIDNVTLDVEPGVRLKGNLNIGTGVRVTRPVWVDYSDGTLVFSYQLSPTYGKAAAEKSLWVNRGDLPRLKIKDLDASAMTHQSIPWPASDTWTTEVIKVASSDSSKAVRDVTADTKWHVSWTPIRGGQRLNAVFSDGTFTRGAFVRTTAGFFLLSSDAAGPAVYSYKFIGQTYVQEGAVDWVSRTAQQARQPRYMRWSVRVYDRRTWSVLLNGEEVLLPKSVSQGEIIEAGFGIYGSAAFTNVAISQVTLMTEREATGKPGLNILIDGDSTAASIYGGLDDALKEAIDGSFGARVYNITNRAVSGDNTGQVATRITTLGVANFNYAVIKVGRNDMQASAPLATSVSNLQGAIDYCLANFCTPVLCIPGQFYSKTEAGGTGQVTTNSQAGAELRAAMIRLAAIKGIPFYEEEAYQGPIQANYIAQPEVVEPRLRDNIHQTNALYRLDGYNIGRIILDHFAREMTPRVEEAPFPNVTGVNFGPQSGWGAASANYSVDDQGRVSLGGFLSPPGGFAGSAGAIVMYTLPPNLRPKSVKRISGRAFTGFVPVDINVDGTITVTGSTSSVTYVALDGVSYEPA